MRKDETPSTRRSCERRGSYAAADGMGTLRDICFNGDCGKWQSACHRASSMDHAVWVPALAGTTVGERRGPTTRRPCKRRGPYAAAAGMGTRLQRLWQKVAERPQSRLIDRSSGMGPQGRRVSPTPNSARHRSDIRSPAFRKSSSPSSGPSPPTSREMDFRFRRTPAAARAARIGGWR